MTADRSLDQIKNLISTGIFKPDKKVLSEVFREMGNMEAVNCLAGMSSFDLDDLHNSLSSRPGFGLKANLIVMYAGPGAGKSTVTNHLFKRIPLKWLVVYTTRDIRVSENESIGNPFSKYNMSWDEFDSIPDDDPDFIKTISLDIRGERTKGYIVDLKKSRSLMEQGYNLIIHSWIWDEFIQRSSAFENTLTICLYVDYKATVKRLAFRNLVEAREKNYLSPEVLNSLPSGPGDTDVEKSLEILGSLDDKSIYEDLLIRIESAAETRKRYETVLKPENISFFKYIVDNSGDPAKAMKDVEAIIIADRYARMEKESTELYEYFKNPLLKAKDLESHNWIQK